jgi:muconolactone D-isomerase
MSTYLQVKLHKSKYTRVRGWLVFLSTARLKYPLITSSRCLHLPIPTVCRSTSSEEAKLVFVDKFSLFEVTLMLFMVEMTVNIPLDMPQAQAEEIKAREKAYAQDLQRSGKWPHIWRVVGEYKNVSIFDVDSNDELHGLLSGLPLFPYMSIKVTALCRHPSAI